MKRALAWLLALALLAVGGHLLWLSPLMELPRTYAELSRIPPPSDLPVPVDNVRANRIADTFGAPRGRDRTHQGVDIFAPRGTAIRSSTWGVVTSIRDGGLGGRQVWVLGPGGERHYYAHLEGWAPGLEAQQIVHAGTLLGFVGDSGNAKGAPPHLHYGIYGNDGAYDPLPLFRSAATVTR